MGNNNFDSFKKAIENLECEDTARQKLLLLADEQEACHRRTMRKSDNLSFLMLLFVAAFFGIFSYFNINSYDGMLSERDSIIDSLTVVNAKQTLRLASAEEMYGIKFDADIPKSERIDSALLLLNVFRDRLSYDKKSNVWTITESMTHDSVVIRDIIKTVPTVHEEKSTYTEIKTPKNDTIQPTP